MSFDTDFDFTNLINKYQAIVDAAQTTLDNISNEISIINSITGYSQLKADRLTELAIEQIQYTARKAGYQSTLNNITSITNLSTSDKNALHTLWGYSGRNAEDYMYIMMRQYINILADSDFIALVNDGSNSGSSKNVLGSIIAERHDIITDYS